MLIEACNLNATNNGLLQADNNNTITAALQTSRSRSTNTSSSTAIGGFADTRSSAGITANPISAVLPESHSFLIRLPA